MTIKKIDEHSKADFFALQSLKGCLFSKEAWCNIYGDGLELYGIFNKDNKLVGGFHLYKSKKAKFLTHYKNPPFTPHIGLFFDNQSGNKSNSLSFEKSIFQALAEFFNKLPFQIFTIALAPQFTDVQHFSWNNFKAIPNYTYQIDLTQNVDTLLKNLASDKRNSINKAGKDGVQVIQNFDLNAVKQMVQNTYLRKAKNLNEAVLNPILHEFSNSENSFSYLASVGTAPTALSFCIHDKTTAYYLLGGYNSANKHQGAGVLALWNCILHAKNLGLNKFDFEGSMIPQVEKYFRGFGGDLVPYFTINKASLPIEMALKFVKREIF